MKSEAEKILAKRCPIMRKLIKTHGPCTLSPDFENSPFQSLVRSISHQQLNGRAAEVIFGRFRDLFPGVDFPTPEAIATVSDEELRGVGFSRAKIAAIRDLAVKTLEGIVPTTEEIEKMENEEIIERLIQVRGIGRWTVEMLLIFKLGRPDVFPADDFGVRNGFRIVQGEEDLPRPRDLRAFAERWRPHGTTAAWYLWRVADAAKGGKVGTYEL